MFTDKGVVKAEAVGEDDRLAVLGQRFGGRALRRVQRHREKSQSHRAVSSGIAGLTAWGRPCFNSM